MPTNFMRWAKQAASETSPTKIKNHTTTLYEHPSGLKELYLFGGYDGRRNHNSIHVFDCDTLTWRTPNVQGLPPKGRNGHTATFAEDQLYILGGWLGSGPLAAADLHVFDLSQMRWHTPDCKGVAPGPCNMHTADYVKSQGLIYVFRGGDGREYLNDLHTLNVNTLTWDVPTVSGTVPSARANHSSSVEDDKLYIFGGWDGSQRLNDIFIFDTRPESLTWSSPFVHGRLPSPRAGMTFTCVRGNMFLFGGSGPNAKCFNDLQIFNCEQSKWLTVTVADIEESKKNHAAGGEDVGGGQKVGEGLMHVGADDFMTSEYHAQLMGKYSVVQDGSNPNSFDDAGENTVVIIGGGPGHRAGHSATLVDRRIFVFGGSHGTEYKDDFYILDTDPAPYVCVSKDNPVKILQSTMSNFLDSEEFSDISFLVEGRVVYAHKVVLSLLSERFRAMFSGGFRETSQSQIEIDMDYRIFMRMMEYLYTGGSPALEDLICHRSTLEHETIEMVCDLMQAADQFFLDHLKQVCESVLKSAVSDDTLEYLLQRANECNAQQLQAICHHAQRNGMFRSSRSRLK